MLLSPSRTGAQQLTWLDEARGNFPTDHCLVPPRDLLCRYGSPEALFRAFISSTQCVRILMLPCVHDSPEDYRQATATRPGKCNRVSIGIYR